MAEIIKTYKQKIPATRFIGITYHNEDRIDGTFTAKWKEWFEKDLFKTISDQINAPENYIYDEHDAYIGLMRYKEGDPFSYRIGMFTPPDTEVPQGFEYMDFPAVTLGVCWIYGRSDEVFYKEDICASKLGDDGYRVTTDDEDAWWFFERYSCPRFTEEDEKGNIILDVCHHIK